MNHLVLDVRPLGFPWETADPFLFCVHHDDAYPAGNEQLGPAAPLAGRQLGQDFDGKDGWRMYHGEVVPGFPQHPHRGFETVTIVRQRLHRSLRLARRDGALRPRRRAVAHRGRRHRPLARCSRCSSATEPNPLELFQIWLNLPSDDKLVDAALRDALERATSRAASSPMTPGARPRSRSSPASSTRRAPPPPPPHSWARAPDTDVAIWTIQMAARRARGRCRRAAHASTRRTLYFFAGARCASASTIAREHRRASSSAQRPSRLARGRRRRASSSLLQGRPIGEPVVQYGPFVMNTRAEIEQAIPDYRRTRFGGWPWPSDDPVHAREAGRFARHADGRIEQIGP